MRFLLVMPEFNEGHFTIDMGIMLQKLSERTSWTVTIASERPVAVPRNLQNVAFGTRSLASLVHLWRNGRRVDVLQLMHFTWRTVLRALLFRSINAFGVCYVKLDLSEPPMQSLESQVRHVAWRWFYRLGLRAIDIVSVESSDMYDRFARFMRSISDARTPEMLLVPSCGFDVDEVSERIDRGIALASGPDFLHVGRLGARPKATEVLLEAFRILVEEFGWHGSLVLVGKTVDQFEIRLASWRQQVLPTTAEMLSVHGAISDRRQLMDMYLQARAFVIASRQEGVPNVFVEAAACGCLLVGTPVGQVVDVIRSVGRGWIAAIDDPRALAGAMRNASAELDDDRRRRERMRNFYAEYSWSAVIERLAAVLETLVLRRSRG